MQRPAGLWGASDLDSPNAYLTLAVLISIDNKVDWRIDGMKYRAFWFRKSIFKPISERTDEIYLLYIYLPAADENTVDL